jgi:NTE family protein
MNSATLRAATAATLLSLCLAPAAGALSTGEDDATTRPRVGLVLGGGGALGAAHIGVIKVLEELHVPIDCIAGTSMGALAGGAYASGMSASELEQFVTSINWQAVFNLEQVRRYQPMNVKRENETVSNKLEFGVHGDGLIAPRALIDTQQIESVIREMVAAQSNVRDFDKLPIPFRAVATDLRSGKMVVFRSGDLAVALRASMSVPGAFAPVEVGDWLLVDGGITRNLPVDVARESCADVIIAVDVDSVPPSDDELRSATGSVGRMLDILIDRNEQASFDSLTDKDVGLTIVLPDMGSTDFQKSRTAIDQGELAARAAASRLASLAVSPEAYAQWRESRMQHVPAGSTLVAAVRFEGVDASNTAYLQSLIRTRPGKPLNEHRVSDDALRIYANGNYESVAHHIERSGNTATVVFTPRPKSWGPTFIAFDFGLEASLSGDPQLLGSALIRRTWPEAGGKEWRGAGQLGGLSYLETDFRLPFGQTRRAFILPRVGWYQSDEDIYLGDERVATYAFRSLRGEMRIGLEMGTWGELQAGLYQRTNDTIKLLGDLRLEDQRGYPDAGYLLEFERDTRDSDLWSTTGSRQRLEAVMSERGLGAKDSYKSALFEWNQSALFRSNALVFFDLAGGSAFGTVPPVQQNFRLGGPGAMTGLQRGQLRSADFVYSRLGLGWRLTDVRVLLNMDLYAGAALEGAQAWNLLDAAPDTNFDLGLQLFVGGRTPFGPVQLTGGYGPHGNYAFFLSLGRPVRGRWR